MGHDISVCPNCKEYVMEGSNDWECDCGFSCNSETGHKWKMSKRRMKMSDAITDVERDAKRIRIQALSQERLINDCKESFKSYCQCKKDLVALGYHLTESFDSIKIWKEY